jgi:hypothetical protein
MRSWRPNVPAIRRLVAISDGTRAGHCGRLSVKTHTYPFYRKVGVTSRSEAIECCASSVCSPIANPPSAVGR